MDGNVMMLLELMDQVAEMGDNASKVVYVPKHEYHITIGGETVTAVSVEPGGKVIIHKFTCAALNVELSAVEVYKYSGDVLDLMQCE